MKISEKLKKVIKGKEIYAKPVSKIIWFLFSIKLLISDKSIAIATNTKSVTDDNTVANKLIQTAYFGTLGNGKNDNSSDVTSISGIANISDVETKDKDNEKVYLLKIPEYKWPSNKKILPKLYIMPCTLICSFFSIFNDIK